MEMMYERSEVMMRVDIQGRQLERERRWRSSRSREDGENGRLDIVDLSALSLEDLPMDISLNLAAISKLDLSCNNLQIIPESLTARLLNVVVLDMHSNQLKSLPNSIGCLSKLKVLNASGNNLKSLPNTIHNCRCLEELNLNFNMLKQLPESIGFELTKLKKLWINSNKLVFLPQSTSQLRNLRVLDARLNCLRQLPEDVENMVSLQVLNVSQNFQHLTSLPNSLGMLMSLTELDISYNSITALPHSVGCLKRLQKLVVEGNPLVSPPSEVMEQGLHVVKEFLCHRMNQSSSHARKHPWSSWFGKLAKCKTFSGARPDHHPHAFTIPDYRSIDGMASPRYLGMFSPRRLFSPKNYFTR